METQSSMSANGLGRHCAFQMLGTAKIKECNAKCDLFFVVGDVHPHQSFK